MTRANQVFGSGMNMTAWVRPGPRLPSKPTSHAETGETNTPCAEPAWKIAAVAELAKGSPLNSQITAQVSSGTADGGLSVDLIPISSKRFTSNGCSQIDFGWNHNGPP
jgi:hypothetical protein